MSSGLPRQLDDLLESGVNSGNLPAIFFGVTGPKEVIYFNQAGNRVYGRPEDGAVDENTAVELFSQTKFVACIGALLLVDRGKIALDDPSDIDKYLPEVGTATVLQRYDEDDTARLVKPARRITLRMLMSHTAGYAYVNNNPHFDRWLESHPHQNPRPGFLLDPTADIASLSTPLQYEPGTSWRYSHSIDWVGILCDRVSGMPFDDYLRTYIFEPCSAPSLTFYPTEDLKSHKVVTCTRDEKGKVIPLPSGFGLNRPTTEADVRNGLLSGGSGLFGTLKDYLAILRRVLASDPRLKPTNPLLSPESYHEVFKPSIQKEGSDGCDRLAAVFAKQYSPSYPTLDGSEVNHSVAGLLNLTDWPDRRKAGSISWAGAAKTQFWLDPTSGVAAVCGTQLLCPNPDLWNDVYAEFEKVVYAQIGAR